MLSSVGIMFNDDWLWIAAIERHETKLILSHLVKVAYLDDQSVQNELERLFIQNHWDRHAVVIAIDAKQCIFRKLEVPFIELRHIDQIICCEAEPHIQCYPIEDLIVGYHVVNRSIDKTKILVAATLKKNIENIIALVEPCGIYPYAIEINIFGTIYLAQSLTKMKSCRRLLLLDIDLSGFNLAFLENGHLQSVRCVRFHINSLLDGISSTIDDTMEIQVSSLSHDLSWDYLAVDKFYQRILKELRRTLVGLDDIEQIYLSGSLKLIQGLPNFLQNHDITTLLWDLSQTIAISDDISEEYISAAPSVIGLALKALEQASGGINFRKGNLRYNQAFDVIKKTLAATMTLLCVCFILIAIHLEVVCHEYSQTYDDLLAKSETIYRQVVPNANLTDIDKWHKIYYVRNQIAKIAQEPSLPFIQDTCQVWAKIFHALNDIRTNYFFTLESLYIDQQYAQFAGKAETDLVLDAITQRFTNAKWVAPVVDSLQVLSTKPVICPSHPQLKRQYKYQIQLKSP